MQDAIRSLTELVFFFFLFLSLTSIGPVFYPFDSCHFLVFRFFFFVSLFLPRLNLFPFFPFLILAPNFFLPLFRSVRINYSQS